MPQPFPMPIAPTLKSPATSARELVELIEDLLTKTPPRLAGVMPERAER